MTTSPLCPECSAPLIPIIFGLPERELLEAADRGEVILGGCVIYGDEKGAQCSACDLGWYVDDRGEPLVFSAWIGGFFGENIRVTLASDDELALSIDDRPSDVRELSTEDLDTLWATADRARIWNWRERYVEEEVMDGTQWSLFAHNSGRRAEVSGSNKYPRGFRVLTREISRIAGHPFQ